MVFSCRSHASVENYKCKASWKFVVSLAGGDTYDVRAYAPVCNNHETLETDEYVTYKRNASTRHYSEKALHMGDASFQPKKVDMMAASSGGRYK